MLRLLAVPVLLSVASAQGWTDHTPTNPLNSPGSRAFPAMCWDAAHGYVLMFGGTVPFWGGLHDTWTWNGTAWNQMSTTQPSSGASYAIPDCAMAFDEPSNQVVLVYQGGTWVWSGSNWIATSASINIPQGGVPMHTAMAYDPIHQQTVLYVGVRFSSFQYLASLTYTWNGIDWTPRTTATTPFPYRNSSMAFDPLANRVVLATSDNGLAAYFEWTGTNWQQRFPTGAPSAAGVLATDSANQRIIVFDGVINSQPNHTWTFGSGALQPLSTPVEPARRFGAGMTYDPVRHRVVLFGGTPLWDPSSNLQLSFGDTWEFELGAGASYTAYGSGCAGSRGVPTLAASFGGAPHIGQMFQATITNVPLQAPVFLFLGLSDTSYGGLPLPFSLAGLGAPSCSLLCAGDDLGLATNVLGTAIWQWHVPNVPGASFYNQAFTFDPTANALGITTSNGAHGVIGF